MNKGLWPGALTTSMKVANEAKTEKRLQVEDETEKLEKKKEKGLQREDDKEDDPAFFV